MPKKDPITGCWVMTLPEFWNSEAEHEGKGRSGSELANDFFDEMMKEEEAERQKLFVPARALEFLQHMAKEWADEDFVVPSEVLVVEYVEYAMSMQKTHTKVVAKCQEGICVAVLDTWSGSRLEPPDADGEIHWRSDAENV